MSNRARELRRGLAAAAPFLLSHHVPGEYDRCYRVAVAGREGHLCARCLGVYPGIVAGVVAGGSVPAGVALALTALLPAPALLDWAATTFREAAGWNPLRTGTGLALGVGYGVGLRLLLAGEAGVVAVGVAYGVVAGGLLWRSLQ